MKEPKKIKKGGNTVADATGKTAGRKAGRNRRGEITRVVGWVQCGLAILAFALYANTLGHEYVLDDPLAVSGNAYVTEGFQGIPGLLTHHYRAGTEGANASVLQYRPLSLITFAIEWSLSPNHPFIHHLMNVVWYMVTIILLFAMLRRVFGGVHWLFPAGAALLFAIHPLHVEVVANIKSRDEILATCFCIAALYCWVRWLQKSGMRWIVLAVFAYFLSLLSKENAVVMFPVFALVSWTFFKRKFRTSVMHALVFMIPLSVFLIIRGLVLSQTPDLHVVSAIDNPVVEASHPGERIGTGFMVLLQYLRLLFVPYPLISDYSYRHLTVVNWTNWQSLLGMISYCVMGIFAIYGVIRRQPLGFFAAAFLLSLVLYSQLPLVIGTLFGERLAYLPSLWFCCAVAYLIWNHTGLKLKSTETQMWPTLKQVRVGLGCFVLITIVFAWQTINRNADWKDTFTLLSTDVEKAPLSLRLNNGVSSAAFKRYQEQRDLSEKEKLELLQRMEQHATIALNIRRNPESYLNLGNAAYGRGQYDKAVEHYEATLQEAPDHPMAITNIGRAYRAWSNEEIRQNKLWQATQLIEKAITYGETDAAIYLNLGSAYAMLNENEKAIQSYEQALRMNPNDRTIWKNLGKVYRTVGNIPKAIECEQRASNE